MKITPKYDTKDGVLGGIQTPDLQDRNLLLYSAELRAHLRILEVALYRAIP